VHLTSWFRKHQRYLLPIVTIMLMVSFGILGTIQSLVGRAEESFGVIRGKGVKRADMAYAGEVLGLAKLILVPDPQVRQMLYGVPRVALLNDALLDFVMAEREEAEYPPEWRLMVLLREADEAGLEATPGEAAEMFQLLLQVWNWQVGSQNAYADFMRMYRLNGTDLNHRMLGLVRVSKLLTLRLEGVLATDAEAWMQYCHDAEQAKVRYVEVDGSWFQDMLRASDEELQAFYEAHKDVVADPEAGVVGYMAPERVKVQYATVSLDELMKIIEISDKDVRAYYNGNKVEFLAETDDDAVDDDSPEEPDGQDGEGDTKPVLYKPLEEVRDAIREKLTRERALEESRQRVEKVLEELRAVEDQYANEPLPLGQMARRHGLTCRVAQTEQGRELLSRQEVESLLPEGAKIAAFAFEEEWSLYYPESFDSDEGTLVCQILERRDPEPQPLKLVLDQVRRDYAEYKALDRAKVFAEKLREDAASRGLAAAAEAATKDLAALMGAGGSKPSDGELTTPRLEVRESDFFSRTSQIVPGIDGPVPQFVSQAFQTGMEQIGVAVEAPPVSRCYVLQPTARRDADRDAFTEVGTYLRAAYLMQKRMAVAHEWMEWLLTASQPTEKLTG